MPTGYTAGILDGEIKNFKQFAEKCMRAFVIQFRDKGWDEEYEKVEPSDYYQRNLNEAKSKLAKVKAMTDEELLRDERERLEESCSRYEERIAETKEKKKLLESFLVEAEAYEAPTENHLGIRKFMIEQLQTTIDHDGNSKFSEELLTEMREQLRNLDAKEIRKDMVADAERDIERYKEEVKKEVDRCNQSNKWVEDYLESIK